MTREPTGIEHRDGCVPAMGFWFCESGCQTTVGEWIPETVPEEIRATMGRLAAIETAAVSAVC